MTTPAIDTHPQVHAPLPKSTTLVRLHITPFSPALYSTLIPAPLQSLAARSGASPSFHAVETFPERGFGYLDLPAADAQRLKQKLHGTTLRGMKLRVEAARPEKTRKKQHADHVDPVSSTTEDASLRNKAHVVAPPSTKGDGVFHGVEMPAGRVVKRGWAEAASTGKDDKKKPRKPASSEEREREKKKPRRAKQVDTSQMIFRTALPANVASKAAEDDVVHKKCRKSKQGSKVQTDVKEFERTNKFPTFLRDTQAGANDGRGASEFIEGKGWVDRHGHVVEEVKIAQRPKQRTEAKIGSVKASASKNKRPRLAAVTPEHEEEESDEESKESSVVSSDSDSEASSSSADPAVEDSEHEHSDGNEALSSPATPAKSILPTISTTPAPSKEVHPLEALFKRPTSRDKKPENLAPINTAFSFFGGPTGNDAAEHEVDDSGLMRPPQTPFTQRDLEHRGMRSAAPTPDTAAIGKRFRLPSVDISQHADSDEDSDDNRDDAKDNEDEDMPDIGFGGEKIGHASTGMDENAANGDKGKEEQNEFEKHFWAHRGEYNRAWKQRKLEARKEMRQSENRRGTGLRGKN